MYSVGNQSDTSPPLQGQQTNSGQYMHSVAGKQNFLTWFIFWPLPDCLAWLQSGQWNGIKSNWTFDKSNLRFGHLDFRDSVGRINESVTNHLISVQRGELNSQI
jgi:hypothetical protein